jgi:hypothetical protein
MPELQQFQTDFLARASQATMRATPMAIYSNTALLGATDALSDNYPVTREIVGRRAFDILALTFARRCPPNTPVLAKYGSAFPDWLANEPIAKRLTYLVDVARCERMWLEALHAADAPALAIADLQARDPIGLFELRLRLHPATRLAWHSTPAIEIWLAHQGERGEEIAPEWRARGALFTRPELTVEAMSLDAAAHRLLCGIRLGETLGAAAGAASSLYPVVDMGTCFAGLVERGAFAALC